MEKMRMRFIRCIVILILTPCISGCSSNLSSAQMQQDDHPELLDQLTSISAIQVESVTAYLFQDLDQDGNDDLIAMICVSDEEGEQHRTNLAVLFGGGGPISIIELASGLGWDVSNTTPLAMDGSTACIQLIDPSTATVYPYQVEISRTALGVDLTVISQN